MENFPIGEGLYVMWEISWRNGHPFVFLGQIFIHVVGPSLMVNEDRSPHRGEPGQGRQKGEKESSNNNLKSLELLYII